MTKPEVRFDFAHLGGHDSMEKAKVDAERRAAKRVRVVTIYHAPTRDKFEPLAYVVVPEGQMCPCCGDAAATLHAWDNDTPK